MVGAMTAEKAAEEEEEEEVVADGGGGRCLATEAASTVRVHRPPACFFSLPPTHSPSVRPSLSSPSSLNFVLLSVFLVFQPLLDPWRYTTP